LQGDGIDREVGYDTGGMRGCGSGGGRHGRAGNAVGAGASGRAGGAGRWDCLHRISCLLLLFLWVIDRVVGGEVGCGGEVGRGWWGALIDLHVGIICGQFNRCYNTNVNTDVNDTITMTYLEMAHEKARL
jgi:hypothetical protein